MTDPTSSAKKMLLIDDDHNFLYAFSGSLELHGYTFHSVNNGFEMKQALDERGGHGETPIIWVYADTSREDGQPAIDLGKEEIIPKPFGHESLLNEISKAFQPPPV